MAGPYPAKKNIMIIKDVEIDSHKA